MPYVLRDAEGKIIRANVRYIAAAESLPYDHPDLVSFLKDNGQDPQKVEQALAELRATDMDMSRTVEDLMMALVKKNVLRMTDFPQQVQDRMSKRTMLRVLLQEIYDQASGKSGALRP